MRVTHDDEGWTQPPSISTRAKAPMRKWVTLVVAGCGLVIVAVGALFYVGADGDPTEASSPQVSVDPTMTGTIPDDEDKPGM